MDRDQELRETHSPFSSPTARPSPQKIVFSTLRFIDYKDAELRNKALLDWYRHSRLHPIQKILAMGRHQSAYKNYIEQQRYRSKQAMDFRILAEVFTKFHNLETLHLDYWSLAIGSLELTNAFGRRVADDLVTLDCEYTLPTLCRALAYSETKSKIFQLEPQDDFRYRKHGEVSALFRLDHPYPPVAFVRPSSRTSPFNPSMRASDAMSHALDRVDDVIYKSTLSKLRELRIVEISKSHQYVDGDTIDYDSHPEETALSSLKPVFRMMVNSSPCIERIYTEGATSLTVIVPDSQLDNLRVWGIRNNQVGLPALTQLLHRYHKSLIKVNFFAVEEWCDCIWPSVLVHLRAMEFARLQVFTCHRSEIQLEFQDYILRKTDLDPLLGLKRVNMRQ